MNGVRMQFDSNGEVIEGGSLEKAMSETPASATPAPKQVGKMRGRFDESTGEFVVETNRPTEYHAAPVQSQGVTVRSNAGPITLAQATGDSIVNIPALQGETSVAVALSLGYLQPRAGGGYELTALAQSATQQPAAQQTEQKPAEKKADEPAGDPRGVDPTSDATENTLKTLTMDTPMALEHLVTGLSKTGRVSDAVIADIARTRGVEESEVRSSVEAMVNDHTRAARQAIARVDSSIDPEQFQTWLMRDPELADKVTRDVMAKSVSEVQAAARTYAKNRDVAIESALVGRGIDTTRIEGKLYMSRKALGLAPKPKMGDFPASDWIAVDQAVRDGYLALNG